VESIKLIGLPKIEDDRGNLTYIQDECQIPLNIKRVFWTYDVPGGQNRSGHAFYKQNEFIVALSGSFDVVFTKADGTINRISLNRSYYGILIPALTWRHLENFSTNALSLHMSDCEYDKLDYIRDFSLYVRLHNV
jgi:hypothetical protein